MKKFLAILLIAFIACEAVEEITLQSIWDNVNEAIDWLRDHGYLDKIKEAIRTIGKYYALKICKNYLNEDICNQVINMF